MRRIEFIVPAEYHDRKVVHFLRGQAGCSAALVKSLKQWEDGILCNGVHTRTIDRLKAGDVLEITLHDTPKIVIAGGSVPILYEDEDIIVFNKPADMPCHQSRNHQEGTLANAFAALCAARGQALTFRAVNRLDRNTTGAVLAAKNARAAALLAGAVDKVYLAVTGTVPNPPQGVIDAPIGRPAALQIRRAVMADGQTAQTVYRTLGVDTPGHALVACTLPTGRTHQIRVHMAHIGVPLLGDDLYGGDCTELKRQALHCARLSFCLPDGEKIQVEAPLPKDMQKYAAVAGQVW